MIKMIQCYLHQVDFKIAALEPFQYQFSSLVKLEILTLKVDFSKFGYNLLAKSSISRIAVTKTLNRQQ